MAREGPDLELAIDDCVATLDPVTTPHYSTTDQARDLAAVIDRIREPGLPVYLYGISYGTAIALRFLQLFPESVDGVILDAVAGPSLDWTFDIPANRSDQIRWLLELCAADPFCSGKLGEDPVQRLLDVLAAIDEGHCPTPAGLTAVDYRDLLSQSYVISHTGRALLAPLVYRIDRCSELDEAVIQHAWSTLTAPEPSELFNLSVHFTVFTSELMPDPPLSSEELREHYSSLLLGIGAGDPIPYRMIWDAWPRAPRDGTQGEVPETSVPALMLHGTADGNLPYEGALEVAAALSGPHQQLVTFPDEAHGVLAGSSSTAVCAQDIVGQFLGDPAGELDVGCAETPAIVDFEQIEDAQSFFGTADPWEG